MIQEQLAVFNSEFTQFLRSEVNVPKSSPKKKNTEKKRHPDIKYDDDKRKWYCGACYEINYYRKKTLLINVSLLSPDFKLIF